MKIRFQTRIEAIDWIVRNVEDEGQFEVLREQLNYNYIYYERYFLELNGPIQEVVLMQKNK